MRTLLALAVLLPACLAGGASAALGERCDPTGSVCVVDTFSGRPDCAGEGYQGADGVSLRHPSAEGGAAAWTRCGTTSNRRDATNAVGVALHVAEVHVTGRWQSEHGDTANKRWILLWFQNPILGDARGEWYAHDGVGCFLVVDVKPLYAAHRSVAPGCLAGGPLAPPSAQWGRILP